MLKKIYLDAKRKEIKSILSNSNASHKQRCYLVGFLKSVQVGYSESEVLKIIGDLNCWQDYDARITAYQVSSIFKSPPLHKNNGEDVVLSKVKRGGSSGVRLNKLKTWYDKNGELHKKSEWGKEIPENQATQQQKQEANIRTVKDNEIVLDYDDKKTFQKAQQQFLQSEFNYYAYKTGQGGHVHLYFNEPVTKQQTQTTRRRFGCDPNYNGTHIAIENKPHFKHKTIKTQIQSRQGLNDISLLEVNENAN